MNEVRVSQRLVGSPAVVVESGTYMTTSMRRVMKMMRREEPAGPESKPDMEINPSHGMMAQLEKTRHQDAELAKQISEQLFDNAMVAAGLLEDPREMVNRMNSLLEKLLAKEAEAAG